jgi:hypothetical protein
MKMRAAIFVGLLWTVFAMNGCASGGPEPNRLGTARRLVLARVSSEENRPTAEAAAGLLLNAVRDAGSIVGAKDFMAEARGLGLGFWAAGMLDRIQTVGWPTPEEGRVLREAFGITTLVMTEVTAFDQVWGKYAKFTRVGVEASVYDIRSEKVLGRVGKDVEVEEMRGRAFQYALEHPVTLPRHVGQLPLHHDMRARGERSEIYGDYSDCESSPLFAFGHGLSYTTFEYGALRVEPGTTDSRTVVEVDVTNAGVRGGEEVVQLYCRDDVASVARPGRELVGCARVSLAPAESATVTFSVPASRLAFHDVTMQRVTEPGTFTFFVGASSIDTRAEATVELSGDRFAHPVRDSEMTSSRVSSRR